MIAKKLFVLVLSVLFLVGPAASYVNGQRIYVDGGGPEL